MPGITPARAGNTPFFNIQKWQILGSPPPVRGILNNSYFPEGYERIPPARAGNTLVLLLRARHCADHPRPCGEYKECQRLLMSMKGSPPPVRGIRRCIRAVKFRHRITPARAGNTKRVACKGIDGKDHPRPCGEYYSGK